MVDDTGCGAADCWGEGRWNCSQIAGWVDASGHHPWGASDDSGLNTYLFSASAEELRELADAAATALDCGAWQGVRTPNGGWVDGPPWNEKERRWRETAAAFLASYQAGERALTEGMLAYAAWDLACELAWLRRWCPGGR